MISDEAESPLILSFQNGTQTGTGLFPGYYPACRLKEKAQKKSLLTRRERLHLR